MFPFHGFEPRYSPGIFVTLSSTIDLQKLKNTTLACRAITRQLTAEEMSRSLLLRVEDLERKKAYDDLVALLFREKREHHNPRGEREFLSFAYLRLLQEKIRAEASSSTHFRFTLYMALEMVLKGSGVMVSVLSQQFYAHLEDPANEKDREFFFSECGVAQKRSGHLTINEFLASICGAVNTPEMKRAAKQLLDEIGVNISPVLLSKQQPPSGNGYLERLGFNQLRDHVSC